MFLKFYKFFFQFNNHQKYTKLFIFIFYFIKLKNFNIYNLNYFTKIYYYAQNSNFILLLNFYS
jgi:hypothetical protein